MAERESLCQFAFDEVGAVCDAFVEWMESQGYNSIEAAEIVASCREQGERVIREHKAESYRKWQTEELRGV